MNRDQFEGKWKEHRGKIKEKWSKLTDNDIAQINGKYDQFMGSLQRRYGYQRQQAEKEFNNWNWGHGNNPSHSNQEHRPNQPEHPRGSPHSQTKEFQEGGHRNESNRDMKNRDTHKDKNREQGKHGNQKGQNPFDQHRRDEEKKRKAG